MAPSLQKERENVANTGSIVKKSTVFAEDFEMMKKRNFFFSKTSVF